MKNLLLLFLFASSSVAFAQNNYPKPPKSANRLFYIQHNLNTNTYVYDAQIKNGKFVTSDPIEVYRIMYAEDGSKKELTSIQRKLAYGIKIHSQNNENVTFNLNGYPTLIWKLSLKDGKPFVSVNLNKQLIYVEKMYIQTKEKTIGPSTKVDYILISGKNNKNQNIIEKFIP